MSMNLVVLLYLVASIFFIQALKGLSHPTTSIRGNLFGMGGMATVYKAYDASTDRYVALKTLPQQYSKDPQFVERFRREALAIPNIIDIYRIAGDYDYMLKVVAADMNDFDRVYQRLIEKISLETVTSLITMEAIADSRDLPL